MIASPKSINAAGSNTPSIRDTSNLYKYPNSVMVIKTPIPVNVAAGTRSCHDRGTLA
jgi:hypothetical protein